MRASLRYNALLLATLSSAALAAGCTEPLDPVGLATAEQAIYYGTRTPTVAPLTAGEQMAIGFLADASGSMFCSGTLIDRDVVVTAQHCTDGSTASEIRFGLGTPSQPRALLQVQQIVEHPNRDAALLLLREDAVSRVPEADPLPFLREALPQSRIGSRVEAAGFGQTHDNSEGLYFAALQLAGIDDEYYTVDGQGQRGICFGDSGGPLLVDLGGHAVVAGVESYGDSSCVDVDNLTRLDRIVDWIDNANGGFVPEPGGGSGGDKPEPSPAPGGGNKPPTSSPGGTPTGGGGTGTGDDGDFGPYLSCSSSGAPLSSALFTMLPLLWLVFAASRRRRLA